TWKMLNQLINGGGMSLSQKKDQDNLFGDIDEWLEDDPFGLDEEIKIVIFKCLDCNGTDEVPDYIIGEFSVDKNNDEEVELHCPHCNGTMIRAKNVPSD
ncbi:hypothetical protein, partial [Piscibacillus halophilus]